MTAMKALEAARAVGIDVVLDGENLALQASSPPPDAVLEDLSQNKAGIVALLRPGDDGWNAEDWQVYFYERAGAAKLDGGLPSQYPHTNLFSAEADARKIALFSRVIAFCVGDCVGSKRAGNRYLWSDILQSL